MDACMLVCAASQQWQKHPPSLLPAPVALFLSIHILLFAGRPGFLCDMDWWGLESIFCLIHSSASFVLHFSAYKHRWVLMIRFSCMCVYSGFIQHGCVLWWVHSKTLGLYSSQTVELIFLVFSGLLCSFDLAGIKTGSHNGHSQIRFIKVYFSSGVILLCAKI